MSDTPAQEDRYFRCSTFSVTMPVSECTTRRKAAKNPLRTSTDNTTNNPFSMRQCAACILFRDETSAENTISREQMFSYLEANPAVEPAPADKRAAHFGSLRTPHKSYGY